MADGSTPTDFNPCLACSIEQDCCHRLDGLVVTAREYERVFARHADRLDVTEVGELRRVSARGAPCPNFEGRCTVYDDRPMECRLFPVTTHVVAVSGDTVRVTVHDRTNCPQKAALMPDDATVTRFVEGFARDAYGPEKAVEVIFERGFGRAAAYGLKAARKAGLARV